MKILVIKLSSLGDVIATTPIFELLKLKYPKAIVHHLVMEHCSIVTSHNKYIDKQIKIKVLPSNNFFSDIITIAKLIFTLLSNRYDTALIFHRSYLLQLICKLAFIRKIYGFGSRGSILLNGLSILNNIENKTFQEVQLLQLFTNEPVHKIPNLRVETDINFSDLKSDFFKDLPDSFITCNISAGNIHSTGHNKIWPIDNFEQVFRKIISPVVLLGNGVHEFEKAEQLRSKFSNKKIFNIVNQCTLIESACIIKKSLFYIGNDSSLTYLSAAVGTPSITIYGPTQSSVYSPVGDNVYFLTAKTHCSPCYEPYDGSKGTMYTCKNNLCMQSITPANVLNLIREKFPNIVIS